MEKPKIIIEQRKEYMVSRIPKADTKPVLRTGHFLRPCLKSIDEPVIKLPPQFHADENYEPKKLPFEAAFNGWRFPPRKWKTWVDRMHSRHKSTWEKAGIHEAIMGSIYIIKRNEDLFFGVAEKWCCETNTFVFAWGEATVTLEDMMILGGYSVLGDSVLSPLETEELKEIEEKLNHARLEIVRTKMKRASQKAWMRYFMEGERDFEHEAFLVLWLSRFVFPKLPKDTISKEVFPVAIQLARGKKIALAPAVLASIYRDLTLLKLKMLGLSEMGVGQRTHNPSEFNLSLWAPFQIVQVWIWERFWNIRPSPNPINNNEPRLARWHDKKKMKISKLRFLLNAVPELFQWRPYASNLDHWSFPKFYPEKEMWVLIDSDLEVEFESFARCLRPSELVGYDCIALYLPHRVAMQFGMDQDIPGNVAGCSRSPENAWRNYSRPISDKELYVPSRLFNSEVSFPYFKWWTLSVLYQQDVVQDAGSQQRSLNSNNGPAFPSEVSLKRNAAQAFGFAEGERRTDVQILSSEKSREMPKDKKEDNWPSVPPGFPPKCKSNGEGSSVDKHMPNAESWSLFTVDIEFVENMDLWMAQRGRIVCPEPTMKE